MRESLTILAALVIFCLSIALAAPYFIDWNGQRGFIETHLSKALGETVSIHGNLDLKLLPTPYLHLQNIEIIDQATSAHFAADDVFLEIAIPPLLRGEIDFIEARLQRPRFNLVQDADGTLRAPQPDHFSGQARFERINIEDGRLEIDDPAQPRDFVLDHLDLSAEASSLAGPFKGDGNCTLGGEKSTFRFSTGTREADALRLKLIVDKSVTHPRADIDGTLTFGRVKDKNSIAASFKGNAALSGLWHRHAGQDDIAVAWRASGPLEIATRQASMDMFDLRLGDEDHAVNATASAELDFSGPPKAHIALHARQIDLDKFLADASQSQPPKTLENILAPILSDPSAKSWPLSLNVDATADTATLNGETLADLSGAFSADPVKPIGIKFEGNLPGRSHLRVDGHIETGSAAQFDGHVEANTSELDRLTTWLAGVSPRSAEALRKLPVHTVDISGDTNFSRVGFSGRGLTLRLDTSMLTGSLSYTEAIGSEPARLFADLNSPSLDLTSLPSLQDAAARLKAMDLSIRFEAHTVKIAGLRGDRGHDTIDTGEIRFRLSKTSDATQLEDLTLSRIGGSNVTAKGTWNGHAGSFDAKLNIPKLADLTDILKHVVPETWLSIATQRAAVLSPLQLDAHAEATASDASSLPTLTTLRLAGTAGATNVKARLQTDPQIPSSGVASATIDAPDSGVLLRQLGARILPLNGLDRGHIEIKTQGSLTAGSDAILQATLGGLSLNFIGRIEPSAANGFSANGQFKATSGDVSHLLQATGLAFPDLATRLPTDLTGDLDWQATQLELRGLKGSFAGTALTGFLTYAPLKDALDKSAKQLTGAIDLDKTSATALLALALGPPQPAKGGFLWSNLSFGTALPDPPTTSLTLHVKSFDILPGLSGEAAALQLDIAPDIFTSRDMTLKTSGGTAAGTMTLRRDGQTAALAGHLTITNYGLNLPSLQARASADLDIAGSGPNALALITSLAGSGHASLSAITVGRADPNALLHVFTDVEHDRLSVDEAEITRALGRELDQGSLNVAPRSFDLGVASGILRLAQTPAADPTPRQQTGSPAVSAEELALAVDLRRAIIDQKIGLSMQALPKDWQGPQPRLSLTFKGPLASPTRTIEAANFVNTLAARAIAREAARIQAYEFDLHERAFFNQRLLLDRRHDEETAKAEEEARLAAEAAHKAEEAARLEKLRKADEARKEEIRKKSEEAERAKAASDALQSQKPGVAADPSTAGRY